MRFLILLFISIFLLLISRLAITFLGILSRKIMEGVYSAIRFLFLFFLLMDFLIGFFPYYNSLFIQIVTLYFLFRSRLILFLWLVYYNLSYNYLVFLLGFHLFRLDRFIKFCINFRLFFCIKFFLISFIIFDIWLGICSRPPCFFG